MSSNDLGLSPTDRTALHQAAELDRRKRAIRKASLRLMATVFVKSPKRYMTLVNEAQQILNKEAQRIWELDHPAKSKQSFKGKSRAPVAPRSGNE